MVGDGVLLFGAGVGVDNRRAWIHGRHPEARSESRQAGLATASGLGGLILEGLADPEPAAENGAIVTNAELVRGAGMFRHARLGRVR